MTEIKFFSECHGPMVFSKNGDLKTKNFGVNGLVEDTISTNGERKRVIRCPALGSGNYVGLCLAVCDVSIRTEPVGKIGLHQYPPERYPLRCQHLRENEN